MKLIFKKLLKIVLVFLIATIIVYLILTTRNFIRFCNYAQISVIGNEAKLYKLDNEKLKDLGEGVKIYADLLEESKEESLYENDGKEHSLGDGHEHSLGEFYDPMGFSVMTYLQNIVFYIVGNCLGISLFCGSAITIAYIIITSNKINNTLKFIIGYIGVMIVIPPLYMYSWTGRFWDFSTMFKRMPKYFYIGYTVIFILMYIMNYTSAKKMSKDLNEAINMKEKDK